MTDITDWPGHPDADPDCECCLGDGLQADGETPCPCIGARAAQTTPDRYRLEGARAMQEAAANTLLRDGFDEGSRAVRLIRAIDAVEVLAGAGDQTGPSELAVLRQQHAAWSARQFGDISAVGPAKHLAKEALEVAAAPTDAVEHADCWMLLWDMQRRAAISDADLASAIREKLAINMARTWPTAKEGEAREHVRYYDTTPHDSELYSAAWASPAALFAISEGRSAWMFPAKAGDDLSGSISLYTAPPGIAVARLVEAVRGMLDATDQWAETAPGSDEEIAATGPMSEAAEATRAALAAMEAGND